MIKTKIWAALILGMSCGMITFYKMKELALEDRVRWIEVSYPAKLVFVGVSLIAYILINLGTVNLDQKNNGLYLLQEKLIISDLIFVMLLVNLWLFGSDFWFPIRWILFD